MRYAHLDVLSQRQVFLAQKGSGTAVEPKNIIIIPIISIGYDLCA